MLRVLICIVVGEYGTKNKSTGFQTWYNPRSSFALVCQGSTRRSKNGSPFLKGSTPRLLTRSRNIKSILDSSKQTNRDLTSLLPHHSKK